MPHPTFKYFGSLGFISIFSLILRMCTVTVFSVWNDGCSRFAKGNPYTRDHGGAAAVFAVMDGHVVKTKYSAGPIDLYLVPMSSLLGEGGWLFGSFFYPE